MFFFSDWNTLVVGKLSPHLALDSPCDTVRQQAEEALAEELNFAAHLTLPAVTLQLHSGPNTNLARHLYSRVVNSCSYQVMPLQSTLYRQQLLLSGDTDGRHTVTVHLQLHLNCLPVFCVLPLPALVLLLAFTALPLLTSFTQPFLLLSFLSTGTVEVPVECRL